MPGDDRRAGLHPQRPARAAAEVPGLAVQPLPPELEPVHALALLSRGPRADRLTVFLLSEAGQALDARHGLLRLAEMGE